MGKKVNYRATQLRNQKVAAERKRQDEEKRTAWWAAHGKQLKLAAVAAVILAAVIWLICWLVGQSALPAEIKDLSAIKDNWVVIDTDSKVSKRYHHPATFDIPAGYTKSEFTTFNDDIQQDFLIEADAEDALVSTVYVSAAPELSAEEYIRRMIQYSSTAINEGTTVEAGEAFTATIAGNEADCVYLAYSAATGDYGCLIVAIDAPKNVCVYASVSGSYTTPENIQTVETLLSEAETLLAGLTIVK